MRKLLLTLLMFIMSISVALADALNMANAFIYTSPEYGFSIPCPKKPNVIPVSALYEGKKGEVLI